MTALKLGRLPDRTPRKLAITLPPKLMAELEAYADVYRRAYGEEVTPAELVPFMLQRFMETDRDFQKARKELESGAELHGAPMAGTATSGADSPAD